MTAGSMTGTSKISSIPMDIGHLVAAAFMATWTGTPNGTLLVEGSIDGSTWAPLQDVSIDPAVGTADSRMVNLFWLAFRYVRLSYTNTSSTGSLTIVGTGKGA
jgi:hypothetical protein